MDQDSEIMRRAHGLEDMGRRAVFGGEEVEHKGRMD